MFVFSHSSLPQSHEAGVQRCQVAGPAQGLPGVQVWLLALAPAAELALPPHPQDHALLVLEGSGRLAWPQGPQRVQAPCTVRLAAGVEHRLLNVGCLGLRALLVCAPVADAASAIPPGGSGG